MYNSKISIQNQKTLHWTCFDDSSVILIMINGNVPSFEELLSISKKAYSVDAFFFPDSIYYKIIARHVKWGFFVPAIWAELQRAQNFPMHCPPARVPITKGVSSTHLHLNFLVQLFFVCQNWGQALCPSYIPTWALIQ